MASKPRDLVTRFVSDVGAFLRGTDQVQAALEEVAQQTQETADKGERSAKELSTAYQRAADKISRDTKEAGRDTKRALGETGKEAGSEFVQNLGQSISSGDLSSVASDTAGGLAASFGMAGPIGIAFAGIATLASVKFGEIQAAAEKMREQVKSEFDAIFAESDRRATLDRRLTEIFGSVSEGIAKIREVSAGANVPLQQIVDALADGGPAAQQLLDKMRQQEDSLNNSPSTSSEWGASMNDALASTIKLEETLGLVVDATREASANASDYARAMKLGAYYAQAGSSYAVGGSTYNSQVPRYGSGSR